jgi:hypothetical protein
MRARKHLTDGDARLQEGRLLGGCSGAGGCAGLRRRHIARDLRPGVSYCEKARWREQGASAYAPSGVSACGAR